MKKPRTKKLTARERAAAASRRLGEKQARRRAERLKKMPEEYIYWNFQFE
jgi:hypothetical protein